jgi:hypothetical protein
MGTTDSIRILHKTSLLTESYAFLKSTNSWCTVSLYSHFSSSNWRMQKNILFAWLYSSCFREIKECIAMPSVAVKRFHVYSCLLGRSSNFDWQYLPRRHRLSPNCSECKWMLDFILLAINTHYIQLNIYLMFLRSDRVVCHAFIYIGKDILRI